MNENDLQGFASFIDSLYHRPSDDARDDNDTKQCKWCEEDMPSEKSGRFCSKFCTSEYYGEDFNEPIL